MTREEYGSAYQCGFNLTVRFLVSRGLSYDTAQETAQAAWTKGWERLAQLRDSSMVLTWMNSIALNIHRSFIRREPLLQSLPELSTSPRVNMAAIDVLRILKCCKQNDRMVLQRHYLEGYKVNEIAQQHGWTETAVRIRLLRARRSVGKRIEAAGQRTNGRLGVSRAGVPAPESFARRSGAAGRSRTLKPAALSDGATLAGLPC